MHAQCRPPAGLRRPPKDFLKSSARHGLPWIIGQNPKDRELRSSQRYDVAALIDPPDPHVDHQIVDVASLGAAVLAALVRMPECLPYSRVEYVAGADGNHSDARYQWRHLCVGERDDAAMGGLANTVKDDGAVRGLSQAHHHHVGVIVAHRGERCSI